MAGLKACALNAAGLAEISHGGIEMVSVCTDLLRRGGRVKISVDTIIQDYINRIPLPLLLRTIKYLKLNIMAAGIICRTELKCN